MDPLGIDGKISRIPGKSNTVKAIFAFQRDFMRQPDGVVDPEGRTLSKLREEARGSSGATAAAAKSVMMAPRAGDGMPPWLQGLNGDKVATTYTPFKESLIAAYRVPRGYQPAAEHYDLPILKIAQDGGGFSATRRLIVSSSKETIENEQAEFDATNLLGCGDLGGGMRFGD